MRSLISLAFLSVVLTISHPQLATSALLSDDMALVPAGEFLMGNPAGSDDLPDEQPQRLISTTSFWIYRYEVTNDAYARFVQTTGHRAPANANPASNL
ncbi:MAG: SUMF1/EgtB/PvdO family nonheme iron enzyme, partial [Nitrospirota bacterium]|nr:SUMF1/EgtB/PvdO family nonheme iron enzyme [Nitrospirota bacterium]